MSYSYVITKRASKDIAKLDGVIKKRLKQKLAFYIAQTDPLSSAKTLTNSPYGDYRWRIGNYRVIFDIDGDVIVVLQVQHRREVYRR